MGERTIQDLQQLQALPLSLKVRLTQDRIRQWVNEFGVNGVYVSFSGGKDSTVLLHIVREMYGDGVVGVFCDTGLEYPEIRNYVKTYPNIVWLKPRMNFKQIIKEYGYPFISKEVSQNVYEVRKYGKDKAVRTYSKFIKDSDYNKKYGGSFSLEKYAYLLDDDAPRITHKCCYVMKKSITKEYEKETGRVPFIGTMASESRLGQTNWIKYGCNAFDSKRKISTPMSFWTEWDVLNYVKHKNISICSVYGDIVEQEQLPGQMSWDDYIGFDVGTKRLTTTGCKRTGCMFCGYGCHLNPPGEGRFELMKKTHPKQYDYIMRPWEQGGLNYKEVIDWINEHGNMNIRY